MVDDPRASAHPNWRISLGQDGPVETILVCPCDAVGTLWTIVLLHASGAEHTVGTFLSRAAAVADALEHATEGRLMILDEELHLARRAVTTPVPDTSRFI